MQLAELLKQKLCFPSSKALVLCALNSCGFTHLNLSYINVISFVGCRTCSRQASECEYFLLKNSQGSRNSQGMNDLGKSFARH